MKQIDALETPARPATSRAAAHETRHSNAPSRNAGGS